jgi:hypothetical protein
LPAELDFRQGQSPTELSAPALNRAATSPVSDNTPQAPCDLSSKGGLLLLRVSSNILNHDSRSKKSGY